MPESFASWSDYQRTVGTLVRSDVIEDATKIWWDLRPSARFPTLELRITDICPLIEDALCIAALFRCLCRSLWRRNKKGCARRTTRFFCSTRTAGEHSAMAWSTVFIDLHRDGPHIERGPGRRTAGSDRRGRGVFRQPGRGRPCSRHSCARHERRPSNCTLSARGRARRRARRRAKKRSRANSSPRRSAAAKDRRRLRVVLGRTLLHPDSIPAT